MKSFGWTNGTDWQAAEPFKYIGTPWFEVFVKDDLQKTVNQTKYEHCGYLSSAGNMFDKYINAPAGAFPLYRERPRQTITLEDLQEQLTVAQGIMETLHKRNMELAARIERLEQSNA